MKAIKLYLLQSFTAATTAQNALKFYLYATPENAQLFDLHRKLQSALYNLC
jgi:hypothetical protein